MASAEVEARKKRLGLWAEKSPVAPWEWRKGNRDQNAKAKPKRRVPTKEGLSTSVYITKSGAELLFDVVSRAYERTSLIVTTNLPFEQWTEVMGSERLTGALLDRLTHRVHILEANGESYRLNEAKKRKKKKS